MRGECSSPARALRTGPRAAQRRAASLRRERRAHALHRVGADPRQTREVREREVSAALEASVDEVAGAALAKTGQRA
jgi:hypothetical protein